MRNHIFLSPGYSDCPDFVPLFFSLMPPDLPDFNAPHNPKERRTINTIITRPKLGIIKTHNPLWLRRRHHLFPAVALDFYLFVTLFFELPDLWTFSFWSSGNSPEQRKIYFDNLPHTQNHKDIFRPDNSNCICFLSFPIHHLYIIRHWIILSLIIKKFNVFNNNLITF